MTSNFHNSRCHTLKPLPRESSTKTQFLSDNITDTQKSCIPNIPDQTFFSFFLFLLSIYITIIFNPVTKIFHIYLPVIAIQYNPVYTHMSHTGRQAGVILIIMFLNGKIQQGTRNLFKLTK